MFLGYYVVRRKDGSVWGISRTPFPWVPKNMIERLERDFPLLSSSEGPETLSPKDQFTQQPKLPNGTRFYMLNL